MPIISALPNTIANGQPRDATPLMADLNHIVNQVNANAAAAADVALIAAANTFTMVQSGPAATSGSNFPITSQVQNSVFLSLTSVSGANTITARSAAVAISAYAKGQMFTFVPASGNSGSVTINIDGVGAAALTKDGTAALSSDDLVTSKAHLIRYYTPPDAMGTGFQVINPAMTALESFQFACSDRVTPITAGTGKGSFRMPYPFMATAVYGELCSAQIGGQIFTVDLNASGVSMLSTRITMDNGVMDSNQATTTPVISNPYVGSRQLITADVDQIGSSGARGLIVTLIGKRRAS